MTDVEMREKLNSVLTKLCDAYKLVCAHDHATKRTLKAAITELETVYDTLCGE